MARKREERPGVRPIYLELPPDVDEGIRALAESLGRSLKEEIVHALRRHLEAPPRLVTPSLGADQQGEGGTARR